MPILDNPKHEAFCQEYVRNRENGKQAYINAGYQTDGNSAEAAASRLLSDVKVKARINEIKGEIRASELVTTAEIINDLKEIKERCMQKEQVYEWDKTAKEMVPTGEWQFKENGALKAIELLGKTIATFTEKSETKHTGDVNINFEPEFANTE